MRLTLGILFYICFSVKAEISAPSEAFYKEQEVVPDIYDETVKLPDQFLTVYFHNEKMITASNYTPTFLNTIIPIINPPTNVDPNAYYTVVHFCPDWMTRENPGFRHILMWLVTNIPGNDFTKGDTIVEYTPPAPTKSAKRPTRIFYALYKQPQGKMTIDIKYHASRETGIRQFWSLKNFVAKYNLGDPVAINLAFTPYDDYSPIIIREFITYKKSKN